MHTFTRYLILPLMVWALAVNFAEAADTQQKAIEAGTAAAGGAAVGFGVVAATGMTAVGMMGGGAGVGASAGPVGAIAGAVVGLAAYGMYQVFWAEP